MLLHMHLSALHSSSSHPTSDPWPLTQLVNMQESQNEENKTHFFPWVSVNGFILIPSFQPLSWNLMKAHLNSQTAVWGSVCRQMGLCMTSRSMTLRRYCRSPLVLFSMSLSVNTSPRTRGVPLLSHSVTRQSWICVRIWATCRLWMSVGSCTRWPVELKPTCRSHTRDPTWSTSGLRYRRTARFPSTSRFSFRSLYLNFSLSLLLKLLKTKMN